MIDTATISAEEYLKLKECEKAIEQGFFLHTIECNDYEASHIKSMTKQEVFDTLKEKLDRAEYEVRKLTKESKSKSDKIDELRRKVKPWYSWFSCDVW